MIVLTLALLLYEEMPAKPAEVVPQVLLKSSDFETIASATSDSGYRLDILESPDGTIVYVESAPITTGPNKLTKDLVNELTPAEVFARAFPGVKVPDSLLSAGWLHQRHTPIPEPDSDGEFHDAEPGRAEAEVIQDLSETEGQMSTDTQLSGDRGAPFEETGLPGCPTWWFEAKFPGGCDNDSQPGRFCYHNAAWAFAYNTKGYDGQAFVCVDSGTAQLEVTVKSNLTTYMIPAGHSIWAYVSSTTHCGCGCFLCLCYSCDLTDKKFIKFDLKPNGASSQIKGNINY